MAKDDLVQIKFTTAYSGKLGVFKAGETTFVSPKDAAQLTTSYSRVNPDPDNGVRGHAGSSASAVLVKA